MLDSCPLPIVIEINVIQSYRHFKVMPFMGSARPRTARISDLDHKCMHKIIISVTVSQPRSHTLVPAIQLW